MKNVNIFASWSFIDTWVCTKSRTITECIWTEVAQHRDTCCDTQFAWSPKIVSQLQALSHVSSWGLAQGLPLVQYKQDFYRHVYEWVVVVPQFWEWLGWARPRHAEPGGGQAKIDVRQDSTYNPVWASGSYTVASALSGFSSGCCFMWALLQGDANCRHSSSVNGIGQYAHAVAWCLVGAHNGACRERTLLWQWTL